MPKPTPGCDEIREWLGAYVIGALEPGEEAPIEAHLVHCSGCRSERDELADVARLLRRALPLLTEAGTARPAERASPGRAVHARGPRQPSATRETATKPQAAPKKDTP
ncbi:zf-HC2 domain-containing protein [Streptomyces iakyrus]|uniref:zf-HC2 domain-containing protein n=1 Tax=Streptomyces iakyrus TaxID=68219 RepID=UPI000527AB9E|nr:zf-HC2 domain-containing protein [Streptomyces iakyrus]